jgi:hypothetical protein
MVIKYTDKTTGKIYYRTYDDYNKYLEELEALTKNESLYEIN